MAHHRASDSRSVGCAVVTVSDTRSPIDDRSGGVVKAALAEGGHAVVDALIVPDEADAIRAAVLAAIARRDVQAVIVTGGTGIAPRDVTIESLAGAWTKELPGFGELFRALSFEEVGAAAFLSRAAAGVVGDTFVALLPGSPQACELALRRLLLPELGHIAGLLCGGARP